MATAPLPPPSLEDLEAMSQQTAQDEPPPPVESKKQMEARHRREAKDFNAEKTAAIKKAKGKAKKALKTEYALKEAQLEAEHERQLAALLSDGAGDDTGGGDGSDDGGDDDGGSGSGSGSANDDADTRGGRRRRQGPSRQQRRKARKEAERAARMAKAEEEAAAAGPTKRAIENEQIAAKLGALGLTYVQIVSDGHCMYRAVEHQLQHVGADEALSFQELRERVADHIDLNENDFRPFLVDPVTGDMLDEDGFEAYLDRIANTAEWGGEVELRALMQVVGRPITVYSATAPEVRMGDGAFEGDPLRLSFHLHQLSAGSHYNSVVSVEGGNATSTS